MATLENRKETFSSITEYLDQVEKQMNSPPDDGGSSQTFGRPASAGSGPRRAFEADTEEGAHIEYNDGTGPVRRSTASRARWRATRDAVRDRDRLRLVEDLDKKAKLQRDRMKVRTPTMLKHAVDMFAHGFVMPGNIATWSTRRVRSITCTSKLLFHPCRNPCLHSKRTKKLARSFNN